MDGRVHFKWNIRWCKSAVEVKCQWNWSSWPLWASVHPTGTQVQAKQSAPLGLAKQRGNNQRNLSINISISHWLLMSLGGHFNFSPESVICWWWYSCYSHTTALHHSPVQLSWAVNLKVEVRSARLFTSRVPIPPQDRHTWS